MIFSMLLAVLLLVPFRPAPAGDRAPLGKPTLYVYTWEDYFSPDAIRRFEEKHGCVVEFDYYDSNDAMVEHLRGGGGYDIMTPPGQTVETLFREGIIRHLEHELIPNLKNIHPYIPNLTPDVRMRYSVPFTVSVTGVGYNPHMVPPDISESWELFNDRRLAGEITLMNDMRETFAAALLFLGHSINTLDAKEIAQAENLLRTWKRNIAIFAVNEATDGLRDSRYSAAQCYDGDIGYISQDNKDIRFFVPREGAPINSDNFVICSDSESPRLAHAFIDHFLEPEIAAENMRTIKFFMPNRTALDLLGDAAGAFPLFTMPPEIRDRCEVLRHLDADAFARYDEAWERVLMGD